MLASTRPNQGKRGRRGIVLVLILGVLALMAVIGVAFATFSGQSRISARNFAQSVNQPQRDDLMDYALEQLICDTADIRSSIRGHSMARDMYGNDGNFNGYLASRPDGAFMPPHGDPYFYITGVTAGTGTLYNLTTNIPANDPAFYGYNFTRWTLRVTYNGTLANGGTGVVAQTLEVLADTSPGAYRVFTVNIAPTDAATTLINPTVTTSFPTGYVTQLPGQYLSAAAGGTLTGVCQFILDGRWLHAFNGPGMTTNAVHANFRYNGLSPNTTGMDEDYDAVDLENWFLAMQSADGSVIIPSFHRPAAIRIDPANGYYDWGGPTNTTPAWADSASRILRPRQADGHDATTFPDLVPGPNGQITYDVDNDGDGQTDSVWVDLGYPARRNAQGQLYKPLFAFMVIGLNGRIPLNTAGNLAGGGPGNGGTHAAHLGNSVSEVDPTYGLQNGFNVNNPTDLGGAFTNPIYGTIPYTADTQVDSGNIDVRLTQLRNLLAGTRPQPNPTSTVPPWVSDPTGQTNGDNNFVLMNNTLYFMPNSIADIGDVDMSGNSPPTVGVLRMTPTVSGRWCESQSVPGYPVPNPSGGAPFNLVMSNFNNRIRAGYSIDVTDLINGIPRDAADDNYNSFDPYPPVSPTDNRLGEVGDLDFLDPAGAFLLPVERMRRYLAPADINGTGHVLQWNNTQYPTGSLSSYDLGGDQWGRVVYYSYFRPPGLPGQVVLPGGTNPGAVVYPWTSGENYPSNIVAPNIANNNSHNNNPLHGFESQRYPNLNYGGNFNPQHAGGVPIDLPLGTPPPPATPYPTIPTTLPTYDAQVNAHVNSDGLNEADEMNLYVTNAQLDSPFGYGDLEWLYRQQDVDGGSLVSRLAQLAPVSFTNTIDGQRRRRLFALDSWETNNFVWANDNPGNMFPNNSSFTPAQDASFRELGLNQLPPNPLLPTPPLAHRDKKINLNYPLPVSNDPNEAVRQKWISDAYQTLKAILPPLAVDTPEELAQLSQYVINIVDFRDPDATMTHWVNPDVSLAVWNGTGTVPVAPVLIAKGAALPTNTVLSNTNGQFDQYGMEFNPIAINEVLAYSFLRKGTSGTATATPRFFIELVNTLTSPETGAFTNNASILDLSGFLSNGSPTTAPQIPWNNGCWDIIFTDDRANNRPDPYLGQLQPPAPTVLGTSNYGVYGLVPLAQNAMASPTAPPATDVNVFPLPQTPVSPGPPAPTQPVPFGQYYFTVIGNNILDFPSSGSTPTESSPPLLAAPNNFTIAQPWDPVDFTVTASPLPASATLPAGALPPQTNGTVNTTYPSTLQTGNPPTPAALASGVGQFFWVCLRRPANPFAPVSALNPMVVVDSMRFPYIEGGGLGQPGSPDTITKAPTNNLYSYQRLQPYRGGQAVPVPPGVGTGIDTRYGYTEQVAPVTATGSNSGNVGNFGTAGAITKPILHTLGRPNEGAFLNPWSATPTQQELWDYFPFNDRDFTSVAELMLVPGCPPGLFTKQFAEFAPTDIAPPDPNTSVTLYFKPAVTANLVTPYLPGPPTVVSGTATNYFNIGYSTGAVAPHTFPYLVDKFFYTGASPSAVPNPLTFGDPTADGWFKMFEFFEVPSQMIGAVGPVAQGTDFDWLRQDFKPGLINLNLIVDEEVFFSVFGKQNTNFNQQLLSFDQLPNPPSFLGGPWPGPLAVGSSPIPLVVTATNAFGAPAFAYPMNNVGVVASDPLLATPGPPPIYTYGNRMKASFAQFLTLLHGGSGFVFGYGSGGTGQNYAVQLANPNPNAPPLANLPSNPIPTSRPFHSLSYPDINYTLMRPAALPPSAFTDPQAPNPPQLITPPTAPTYPPAYTGNFIGDPGVRNPNLSWGFITQNPPSTTGTPPVSTTTNLYLPPPIPLRRLFQPPDAYAPGSPTSPSNASETGDPYVNVVSPNSTAPLPPATGALPPFQVAVPGVPPTTVTCAANDGVVNLFWVPTLLPSGVTNPYFGANSVAAVAASPGPPPVAAAPAQIDQKQHPYFRTEMLQKAMNLTTVRTHQYAVWITVGFFEVTRQGDLLMAGAGAGTPAAALAFDILGPEIGASTGQTTRFRGFFLVDRLQLTGYDPNIIGSFRPAVVYRQTIE